MQTLIPTQEKMIAVYDDGGRSNSSHPDERWDCGVRAVAIVLDMDYDDVHRAFRQRGRKAGDGITLTQLDLVLSELCSLKGKSFSSVSCRNLRTQNVIKAYSGYTLILDTYIEFREKKYEHLCAIKEGVVHDLWLPYDQPVKRIYAIID